ncbi:hypothetical protein HCG49_16940 [Arenibacter sp. 6A1]|uniref:hypothetical protein n=1 Tax=Arenibacter sp. 6A1 TaxID=2720391 RepID=UPI001446BE1F|nr:hypothetical protein [Arenibacter sp. 6A1]NKI28242.1 hypothetical protein [Arenibacter sp. 6A1]
MSLEYRITKTQIECIEIIGKHYSFAKFYLDYSENQGRLSISSDYGSWSFYWGACGIPFKEFLIGLDKHYVAGKFGEDKYFDLEKTISSLKDRINEYATDSYEKKELKRELKTLKNSSNKEEFIRKMWNCDEILEMENNCPDLVETISPSFDNFWSKFWPIFINELKSKNT